MVKGKRVPKFRGLEFKLYGIMWFKERMSFPDGSDSKESACNVGDSGLIPGSGRPLEVDLTTHSSILAWMCPWTDEPGGLQSSGSQRVRHD